MTTVQILYKYNFHTAIVGTKSSWRSDIGQLICLEQVGSQIIVLNQ